MHVKSLQSCLTLCISMDSPVQGILQARILAWLAIFTSGDLPDPGIEPESLMSPALAGRFLPLAPPGKPLIKCESESEVAQSCLTLSDSMDCSLPGFSAHGIFQARVLEWGAIAFSDIVY